ncbi:Uncharacterised protein [Mycobacteroides abscessus subsp. massiliense]|nr:Uncharacterised protein [Mycobacteroides abscessus subsp. massiliense]SKH91890.1 Uncharacterised protein [Mycobacteroides abscessus subsp. massiliense]SKI12506.1 Uncharacterised protein [Mycobacteroides abscessus subsp. massiliense]SKK22243.1 Uncharacterised protein [Mycobacteroides abscessus subsp. massiliense]SKK30991.1 Uncharacterised protein [Mycobacteroides abscessus subsp. massiliense]
MACVRVNPDPTGYPARAAHYRLQAARYSAGGDERLARECVEFASRCEILARRAPGER